MCLNRHVIIRPLCWVGCFGLGPCLCLCSVRQIMFRHAVLLMSTGKVFMASSDYRHTSLRSTRCSELNHRWGTQWQSITSHCGLIGLSAKCHCGTFAERELLIKICKLRRNVEFIPPFSIWIQSLWNYVAATFITVTTSATSQDPLKPLHTTYCIKTTFL